VVFLGTPGVGKTHLAVSLGIIAAQNRFSTYYINCHSLIEQLKKAHHENRLAGRLKQFAKTSNKPFSQWNEVFSDLHHATVVNIKGEFYCLKEHKETKTKN